jgi:hypothetical protein
LDLVDWDNPLTEGTYTYKVVAVSALSGNDRVLDSGVVFNGTSTYTVTFEAAEIPARNADTAAWIKVDAPTVEDGPVGKRVVLTTAANLKYKVKVALGEAVEGADFFYYYVDDVSVMPSSSYPFSNLKYVDIPEIGGNSTVEITASYYSDYYPQTAVQRKVVAQQDVGLNMPSWDTVYRFGDLSQYVQFTWTNDPQATGYTIYKAEVDNYTSYPPPPYSQIRVD